MERSKAAQDAGHQVVPQVAGRSFGILICLSTKHCFKDMPSFAPLRNMSFAKQPEAMGDADLQARLIRESKASMHILRETQPMVAQVVNGFDRQPLPGDPVDYEPTPDRAITTLASVNGVEPIEEFYEQLCERNGAAILTMPFLCSAHRNGDALYEMLTRWARDRTRGPKLPLQSVVKKMTADAAALCGLTDRGVLEVGKCADVITREHDQFTGARPGASSICNRSHYDWRSVTAITLTSSVGVVATTPRSGAQWKPWTTGLGLIRMH